MAKYLEKALVSNPEAKLEGAEKPYMDLGDHLEYIESLLEQGAGGGGKSVPPTLNLLDIETEEVRTSITQEEKDNLENGFYNQIIYYTGDDLSSVYSPSKLFNIEGEYCFVQFKIFANENGTLSYSSMVLNSITIGEKNTSNEYPITVTVLETINPSSAGGGGGGSGSSSILKKDGTFVSEEDGTIINSISLSSEEYGKVVNGEISVIYGDIQRNGGSSLYYVYFSGIVSGNYVYSLSHTSYDNNMTSIINVQLIINKGNCTLVKVEFKQPYIPTLPSDASSKTYTLKAVNGVLTWVE